MVKSKEKLNNGCIKIFKLLKLLYENEATYESVINIFKDEIDEQTSNNLQVILNKNLNTLKVFGIQVHKEKRKYILDSSFYSLDFTLEDLKSIGILLNSSNNFPEKKYGDSAKELLSNLILRMNNENRDILNEIAQNYNFGFYFSDLHEQINKCKAICDTNQQCEVLYIKHKRRVTCKCSPKGLIYGSKTVYLDCYDITKNQKLEIPLKSIVNINILPQVATKKESPTTVVFKVKNRLAKSYKLKENEHSDGYDKDGNQIIVNRGEPFDKLLSRLMRYSINCEVISPKSLRNEMLNKINETLDNYE